MPAAAYSPASSTRLGFTVVALDPNADAVGLDEKANARDGLPGEARHLRYDHDTFDVAYYQDTLETTRDLNRVLSEAARVLSHRGAFVYDTVNRTALSRLIYLRALQSWHATRLMPPHRYASQRLRPPDELAAAMSRHGLCNRDVTALTPASPAQRFARCAPPPADTSKRPSSPASPGCTSRPASHPRSPTSGSPHLSPDRLADAAN